MFGKGKVIININSDAGSEVLDILKDIQTKLNQEIMANQERFDALMARLDTVTTDIAGDYKQLLDEIAKGSISDESFTLHEANIAKLEALGASVENPIPPDPDPV